MLRGRDDPAALLRHHDHHLALERLAAQALTEADAVSAFTYADRRCRIQPPPGAHCFVLRAEAACRLGQRQAALDDLAEALAIAPHDVGANRRMLAWAEDDRQRAAAANLIRHDLSPPNLRAAIAVLRSAGERRWARVSVFDNYVSGWVAWIGHAKIEARLGLQDGTLTSLLEPDPFHPLTTREIHSSAFHIRRPASTVPQQLMLFSDGDCFLVRRLPPNLEPSTSAIEFRSSAASAPITVIVPVYGDTEATTACFESLLKAQAASSNPVEGAAKTSASPPFRILAIDDASPEPELRSFLLRLAAAKKIELLVNPFNLGFVGSVNRALAEVTEGDVVLLNADTVVPPGFVDRLSAAAHSALDIGTATPLSNNADIFSFPTPGAENPLHGYENVIALDRATAVANANVIADVPSGIGFCLFITRACLNAVGSLSEHFERGYLEDIDFCLRARAKGFRNVCAASVYVGHHGSKSFGGEKRRLVVRNLGVLDQRFPTYRRECRAFEAADPLRFARAALDRALLPDAGPWVLIAGGRGLGLELAQARADLLAQRNRRSLLLSWHGNGMRLTAADGGTPQSIALAYDTERAVSTTISELGALRPAHLEIIDPTLAPLLIELARGLKQSADFWITTDLKEETLAALDPADRILAPTEAAWLFARAQLPGHEVMLEPWPAQPLALPSRADVTASSLAVIPAGPSSAAWRVIWAMVEHLQNLKRSVPLLIVGTTLDDHRLMSFPNVFVTGPVTAEELPKVLEPHNPAWLLTDFEAPLFGHPLIEATRRAERPVAYRDWSGGALKSRNGDLALSRTADERAVAHAVTRWISRS